MQGGNTRTFYSLNGLSGITEVPAVRAVVSTPSMVFAALGTVVARLSPQGTVLGTTDLGGAPIQALASDSAGNAYAAVGCSIMRVDRAGTATTIAGSATVCGTSDGPETTARFSHPAGLAVNSSGTIYVADTENSTIRMINSNRFVTTILGAAGTTGTADGLGTSARFNRPTGLAVDSDGALLVADTANLTIRRVTTFGIVSTIAGTAGVPGTADGTGAGARFMGPRGLSFGPDGTLFVADTGASSLREISRTGVVTTINSGTAKAPRGLSVDASGAIYVADTGNEAVRLATVGVPSAPVITAQPARTLAASQSVARFTVRATGTPSPAYRWQVSSDGGGAWVDLPESVPYSGTFTDTLTVTAPSASLSGFQYRCVLSNGPGATTSAAATLLVGTVSVSPSRIDFAAVKRPGDSSNEIQSSAQTVTINWNGAAAPWSVSTDRSWLYVSPASGSGAGSFTVDVILGGPAPGTPSNGNVTVSSPNANLTFTIPVTFTTHSTDGAPVGVLDTPADNATGLSGSIAVTGWAIDDITVDRVEIWRDPVPGEGLPPNGGTGDRAGKVFVGFATFVPGARPDVQAQFPSAPNVYSAGWGYMLLTYGLLLAGCSCS